jgi:hypothetical protein
MWCIYVVSAWLTTSFSFACRVSTLTGIVALLSPPHNACIAHKACRLTMDIEHGQADQLEQLRRGVRQQLAKAGLPSVLHNLLSEYKRTGEMVSPDEALEVLQVRA